MNKAISLSQLSGDNQFVTNLFAGAAILYEVFFRPAFRLITNSPEYVILIKASQT